ncbi:MAG: sigma-70 family RNA polymerase sigma factor [Planctomycetes bacterium]|nr:sigma-70 family RNA polymerase sigma factor [Planctomycetota bacterium]
MTSIPQRDPQELLQHEPFVRELARLLVGDRQQAEDLAQDAWLAALEAGPAPMHTPRGWLTTVLRRLAGKQRRSAKRRRDREDFVAGQQPDRAPSVDELLQREHARAAVVKAVLALPDAYRDVVVLRWFEGLPPRDVAKRLGVPVETVRTRHRRAFERLREELDAQHGGDRAAWFAALAPLADTSLVAGVATTTLLGGLLMLSMKTKLLTATAAALVIGLVTWSLMAPPIVPPPPDEHASNPVAAATSGSASTPKEAAQASTAGERTAVADAPPSTAATSAATTGSLTVTVQWSDGAAAEGVAVQLLGAVTDNRQAYTDATGVVTFAAIRPATVLASGNRGGLQDCEPVPVEIVAGAEATATLQMRDGLDLTGSVVDGEAHPIADAEVLVVGRGGREPVVVACTDADGRFLARDVDSVCYAGARAAGFAASGLRQVAGSVGGSIELQLVLDQRGGSLRGLALDADGEPVRGALVYLGVQGAMPGEETAPAYEARRTDDDGRFVCDSLAAGELPVAIVTRSMHSEAFAVEVRAGETVEQTFRLQPGAAVHGVARDSLGRPVAGAFLSVFGSGPFAVADRTAADGSYAMRDIGPGNLHLSLSTEGGDTVEHDLDVAPGETVRWDPVLPVQATLRGRVVAHDGAPIAGATITGTHYPDTAGPWFAIAKTDDEGRFELSNCEPAVPIYLTVRTSRVQQLRRAGVVPGDDEVVVTMPTPTAAHIRGRVVDGQGAPLANVIVGVAADDAHAGGVGVSEANHPDGGFEFGPLPAGAYHLVLRAEGFAAMRVPQRTLVDGETWNVGELRMRRGGKLRATLIGAHVPSDRQLRIRRGDAFATSVDVVGGRLESALLAPGDYLLQVDGDDVAAEQLPFTIRDGHDTELDVPVHSGTAVTMTFAGAADEPAPRELQVTIRDADSGAPRLVAGTWENGGHVLRTMLPPGRYRVDAHGPNKLQHTLGCTFELEVGAAAIDRTAPLTARR